MNDTELRHMLGNDDVRETFLVAILAVASAKLPALSALAQLPNDNPAVPIQALALAGILTTMMREQGVDVTGDSPASRMGPGNPAALTRFIKLITFEGSQYVDASTSEPYWPYTTFQAILDEIAAGTFIVRVYTLVEAYYAIRAAGIEQTPAAILAMPGTKP